MYRVLLSAKGAMSFRPPSDGCIRLTAQASTLSLPDVRVVNLYANGLEACQVTVINIKGFIQGISVGAKDC